MMNSIGLRGILLSVCLAVSACGDANIINDVQTLARAGQQSPEQRELSKAERSYANARVGAAVAGGLLGAGLAIINDRSPEEVAAAAAIGATGGYLAAGALTARDASFRLTAENLQSDINAAREENKRMTRSVKAAQNVVTYQKREISRLNTALAQGTVTTQEYRATYSTMQKDLRNTQSLISTSQERLNGLEKSVSAYSRAGLNTSALRAQRDAQRARISELRRAEQQIVANLARVPSAVKS